MIWFLIAGLAVPLVSEVIFAVRMVRGLQRLGRWLCGIPAGDVLLAYGEWLRHDKANMAIDVVLALVMAGSVAGVRVWMGRSVPW